MSDIRDKIKASDDIQRELVECPEWGVTIEIRSFTGLDRAKLIQRCLRSDGTIDPIKWQEGLITDCCHDPESGERLFSPDDALWLMQKSSEPIERIVNIVIRINGLDQNATKDAEKK